jgi:DNA-binding phage protein
LFSEEVVRAIDGKILPKQRSIGVNILEKAMTRRSAHWNEGLARDLRDKHFASEFIQGCLEEGLSLQEALAKVIRAYGMKEFAAKAKLPSSNILRAINVKHNPKVETLNALLKPFALCISVAPRRARKGSRA